MDNEGDLLTWLAIVVDGFNAQAWMVKHSDTDCLKCTQAALSLTNYPGTNEEFIDQICAGMKSALSQAAEAKKVVTSVEKALDKLNRQSISKMN